MGREQERIREIEDVINIARNWRRELEKHLTGENDNHLIIELQEDLEELVLPKLKGLTHNDNEYFQIGSRAWDQVTILVLESRQLALERKIKQVQNGRRFYWWFYG